MNNYELLNNLDSNIIPIDTYYNKAVIAVKECAKLDEAKEWTDKMSALAYYHKQAGDKTLENYAIRIRHRGQRRMGELLKQFDGRGGDRKSDNIKTDAADGFDSQKETAQNIGLSERQQLQSVRLSNIPEATFNEMVESENVPTLTQLAELGTKKSQTKPDKSYKAVGFLGWLRDFKKACDEDDPIFLLSVMDEKQKQKTLKTIKELENWFDTFVVNCDTE